MCGIVGVVSQAPVAQKAVAGMRDQLAHRGPDHAGLWQSDDLQVCFGHRRLAIIDLNPEANQPFVSTSGRYVVTYNGEIYNFQELRHGLEGEGVHFRTRSDTEVLVEAYHRWGEDCLERFSGMFAFAIWDQVERKLFCGRDRVGEKPFYYATVGNSFIFASELKALLPWPEFRRQIHYPALIDYLTFGFVVDPKTIWEGCYKLPAGHKMCVDLDGEGIPRAQAAVPYWDMLFEPDHTVEDWDPIILEALEEASQEMTVADVPVGSFLSGGVDSSSVTAALSRNGSTVNAFTIGFEKQAFDERPWAREVARRYETPLVERVVRAEDVAQVFEKMLWHYDEPFNDYSYLPTFYLCREARKDVTVALSGDGGDELFAGYLKYQRLGRQEQVRKWIPQPLGQVIAAGAALFLPSTTTIRRTMLQYGWDVSRTLADMLTLGFSRQQLKSVARGPLATALRHYDPLDTVLALLRKAPPEEVGLINAMRYLDLKLTLSGDILVKVDRASMAVALEVRPVYLNRRLIELAGQIPANRLADGSHSKEALKSALRAWLPETLLYRNKQGFAMPLERWLNGELQSRIAPLSGAQSFLSEVIAPELFETLIDTHRAGKVNQTARIHSLFFLDGWLGEWYENSRDRSLHESLARHSS